MEGSYVKIRSSFFLDRSIYERVVDGVVEILDWTLHDATVVGATVFARVVLKGNFNSLTTEVKKYCVVAEGCGIAVRDKTGYRKSFFYCICYDFSYYSVAEKLHITLGN